MAAVSLLGSTFTTTAGEHTCTVTPAVGDLIVLVEVWTTDASSAGGGVTDDQSGTYYKVLTNGHYVSAVGESVYFAIHFREAAITSATSTIFTQNNPPGSDSGGGLAVLKVTGMSKFGSSAVRQYKERSGDTADVEPYTGTWTSAKLTTNPVIGVHVELEDSTPGLTPTTGYTELFDGGYATPATGIYIQKIDSGDTTNTMVLGSVNSQTWSIAGVELDASNTGNMFLMF